MLKTKIEEKVNQIALAHAKILERECEEACKRFNAKPEDLIIEYHSNEVINIKIQVVRLKIENKFVIDSSYEDFK
jgi:hypothetical protein